MKMRFYSRNRKEGSKFSASLWRRYAPYYSGGQVVDDGWVNAATNSSASGHSRGSSGLGALLVANRCPAHVRGQGASACVGRCERTDSIQCGDVFFVPWGHGS